MTPDASRVVVDRAGRHASLEATAAGRATLRLDSGQRLDLPADLIIVAPDGSHRIEAVFEELAATALETGEEVVLQEVEERLDVGRRLRETGRVRVTRRVDAHTEVADEPLRRERVEVERVPIGRYVEAVEAIRDEGGVTVIPVYEEVLVVQKRLRLKEEVRITKRVEEAREPQEVTLRRATVEVERLGPSPPA